MATPSIGDLLADRYSLAAHINDDSSGRQVWRGMDVLLNRPVTVVLRIPGGDAAEEMLAAAVAASRVNHPNIVGVYDAVDQGDCAYVVREWVEGQSLRDAISATALEVVDVVEIVQCVAAAVAAVHATGVAHGNIHPGTVLLSTDDRAVLADPRADATATQVGDVRALGATLYCALTGGWPRTVPGPVSLPDGPVDAGGDPLPVSQVRDDVPERLDTLVSELLSAQIAPPSAADLSTELSRLARIADDSTGALALVTPDPDRPQPPLPPRSMRKRLLVGAGALVGLAIAGLIAAMVLIPGEQPTDPGETAQNQTGEEAGQEDDTPAEPTRLELSPDRITVVDPDDGDDSARQNPGFVVDGDGGTAWKTSVYKQVDWGGFKEGMGLLIDLGEEHEVATVNLRMSVSGTTVGVYVGDPGMPGTTPELTVIAEAQDDAGESVTFTPVTDAPATRYLLVWCSVPAELGFEQYQWTVTEIEVFAR
ncbi:protein kinase family protein [Stackebrandtia albiflava]|uniref:protein kinase family protein n=1 Tax=Stackebrandtia albiflava TaxID=406432 RepID=UPI001315323B|nr:protein kinase family protein [Stackebrandtia albiflava]